MPAKSIVTRLKHVTNARRATRKCQISLSHKPGTVETVRFPRKMLLEQGWTCEKMPLSWKKMGSEAYKLEVKASHMLLRGLHPT